MTLFYKILKKNLKHKKIVYNESYKKLKKFLNYVKVVLFFSFGTF